MKLPTLVKEAATQAKLRTKTAEIHLLTGGTGSGKSTLAKKLLAEGKYDEVYTTDIGKVIAGEYIKPDNPRKARLEKQLRILAAHRAGKKVLVEGFPRGLERYKDVIAHSTDMKVLDPGAPLPGCGESLNGLLGASRHCCVI